PHLSPTFEDRFRRNHDRTEPGISEITVKAHRGQVMQKVMQKMKANFLADLVRMAASFSPRVTQFTWPDSSCRIANRSAEAGNSRRQTRGRVGQSIPSHINSAFSNSGSARRRPDFSGDDSGLFSPNPKTAGMASRYKQFGS